MKKTIQKYLLLTTLAFVISACGREEDIAPSPTMPSISFSPEIDTFSGQPGDSLNLIVNIDGERGFSSFTIEKYDGQTLLNSDAIEDAGKAHIPVPYSYDFSYVLREEDIDKAIKLLFVMQSALYLPDGGVMTGIHPKELKITVNKKE